MLRDPDPLISPNEGRVVSRLKRIEKLFDELLDQPPESWSKYLLEACPDDESLRDEVLDLLESDRSSAGTLQGARLVDSDSGSPVGRKGLGSDDTLTGHRIPGSRAGGAPGASGPGYLPGDPIDAYRLGEVLGEGGMGTVFRAEQEHPIRRSVALKVVKLGMDSREVIARFEAERQALALMSHPSVAKVLDAGTTESGRPYFVMELVDGVPITQYCDDHKLTTEKRLELFIPVCEAIQHAHQKGIVHRDVKPSNVLVSFRDGKPLPVVIDFGIAKAIHTPLTEQTLRTHDQFLGTPEYMSPEQASLSGVDVDTRTDIYSLGVLLYELLTGTTPFDSAELRRAGLLEIHRIIREVEPPKPSTRLSLRGTNHQSETEPRSAHPSTLGKTLRGDLDWIVMKCLEKERERRYGSPSELVLDLRRHLNLEPVLAGPPSTLYRLRKFVRKNRLSVSAASAVLLALVVGLGVSLTLYFETLEANRRVIKSEQMARLEAKVAKEEAHKAYAIQGFVTSLLASPDPDSMGIDTRVTTVLARGRADLDDSFAEQPGVRAALSNTLGMSYRALGKYEEAEALLRSAVAEADPRERVKAYTNLASVLAIRGELGEAEELITDALESPDERTPEQDLHWAHIHLASVIGDLDRVEEALSSMDEGIAGLTTTLGPRHADVLQALRIKATLYQRFGHTGEALGVLEDLLRRASEAGLESHTTVLLAQNNLGLCLTLEGKHEEARAIFEQVLRVRTERLGAQHIDVYATMVNLAVAHQKLDNPRRARQYFDQAILGYRKIHGPSHPRTLQAMNNLSVFLIQQRELYEAERNQRQIMLLRGHTEGFEAERIANLHTLAEILALQNKTKEALDLYEQVLKEAREILPEKHMRLAIYRGTYGRTLLKLGRFEEAEEELTSSVEQLYEQVGSHHEFTQSALHVLARLYSETGRPREALRLEQRLQQRARQ